MIGALRRRFLFLAVVSLAGTLALLCLVIHLGHRRLTADRADQVIATLYENAGQFPEPEGGADPSARPGFQITQETPFETRFFLVRLTGEFEVAEVDTAHIAALDRGMVVELVAEILESGRSSGYTGYYRYGVFEEAEGGWTIVGLDCFLQLQAVSSVLRLVLLDSLACVAIVFVLLLLLSRRVVRPFAENLEKQRRFVTDASHELKTPLAIISANTGLLSATLGENRWLESTQTQVERLDRLVGHLVELARSEEDLGREEGAEVDLSRLALRQLEDFQPLAEAAGKKLEGDVAPGLRVWGAEAELDRLLALLLDNGVKYCRGPGPIRLELKRRGRWVTLVCSNPCRGLEPGQLPRLFDRFYRADPSRTRTSGGYGIGLSTARAIAVRHRGKLTASLEGDRVSFTLRLPPG